MLEILADADDLYAEDDAKAYFEGIATATDISIDTLKNDPRVAELLQEKIDHNVKEEIKIWLEAEIEAGGETTPDKLKDVVKSRLVNLRVQEAVFSRVWDHLKQDLPVYYAKNFATQFKNRNEDDGFVAEIENVFSSDSIWAIIDGLKRNKVSFSEKFSSDDWQSVNSILELKMSEFLEKRQAARKEVMGRLNLCKKDISDVEQSFYKLLSFGYHDRISKDFGYDSFIVRLDYAMQKAVTNLSKEINKQRSRVSQLRENRQKIEQFLQEYDAAMDDPERQGDLFSKLRFFIVLNSLNVSGSRDFDREYIEKECLKDIDRRAESSQSMMRDSTEELKKLGPIVQKFNELVQQYKHELEQQRVLDVKYKWSDNQRNSVAEDLTTLADELNNKTITNQLRSFATDFQ